MEDLFELRYGAEWEEADVLGYFADEQSALSQATQYGNYRRMNLKKGNKISLGNNIYKYEFGSEFNFFFIKFVEPLQDVPT